MPIRRVGEDFAAGRCVSRCRVSVVPFGKLLESGVGPPRRRLREALAGPSAVPVPPAPKRVRLSVATTSPTGDSFSGMKRPFLATTAEPSQLVRTRRLSGPDRTTGLSRTHLRGVDGVVPCVEAAAKPLSEEAARVAKRLKQAKTIESRDDIQRLPGRTRLETWKVGLEARSQYLAALWMLASWGLGRSTTPTRGDPSLSNWDSVMFVKELGEDDLMLDDLCASFLDQAYWAGASSYWGGRLSSAVAWLLPQHQKQGTGALPRLAQSRAAAMVCSPGGTRLPYPEEIIFGLLMTMCYLLENQGKGYWSVIGLMLAHHCYLRPGEIFSLTWRRIVAASPRSDDRAVLTLHPSEGSKASKTGEYDETVIIDLKWLSRLLCRMRREVSNFDLPVMDLPARVVQQVFEQAQEALDLKRALGRQTLYVLRHSGATADAWLRRRLMDEIQKRGRWKHSASTRRYEKSGRVAERRSACSATTLSYSLRSETKLAAVLEKQCRPLRPPSFSA